MALFNIVMIGVDIYLFTYFIKLAMNSSDMSFRLVLCLLATFEVFFIKKDICNILPKKNSN